MVTESQQRADTAPVDRVPELTHYRDEGCVVWHACLSCPLPRCIYDEPRGARGAGSRLRDIEIARRARDGWSTARLAAYYGVTRRHIFRILRRERRSVPGP